jgi:hypothetical protein
MAMLEKVAPDRVRFWCPGCQEFHWIDPTRWQVMGPEQAPTVRPSVLVTSGHFIVGHTGPSCWCTWNAAHPDEPALSTCRRCHLFIDSGQLRYLADSTHELAGQTVPMRLPP